MLTSERNNFKQFYVSSIFIQMLGKTVLVIGSGTSAHDIVLQLSGTAKRVTFSQYARPDESNEDRKKRLGGYGKNVIHKYNVNFLTTDGAEFTDETQQTFDVIICATGELIKQISIS